METKENYKVEKNKFDVTNIVPEVQKSWPSLGDLYRSLFFGCPHLTSFLVPIGHAFSVVLITCNQTLLSSLGLNGRKNKIFTLNRDDIINVRGTLKFYITKLQNFLKMYIIFLKLLVFMNLISKVEFWCFHWANMFTDMFF